MTVKDIRKTEAYKLNVELEEFIKPNGEELSPEEEEKVCDMEVVQINKSKEQTGAYEFVVIPECEVYGFLENEVRKKKIKKHLDSLNLNDYDLGGVEITEEDIEDIERGVNARETIESATDEVLYGIRLCLDTGLDDIEE